MSASDTIVLTLKDDASTDFTLSLSQPPTTNTNILSSTHTSIPVGTYSATLSYQDSLQNSATTASNTGITIIATGGGCTLRELSNFQIEWVWMLFTFILITIWLRLYYLKQQRSK